MPEDLDLGFGSFSSSGEAGGRTGAAAPGPVYSLHAESVVGHCRLLCSVKFDIQIQIQKWFTIGISSNSGNEKNKFKFKFKFKNRVR